MELLQQECVSLPLSVDFNATTMVAADPTNSFLQNTAFSSAAADRHRHRENNGALSRHSLSSKTVALSSASSSTHSVFATLVVLQLWLLLANMTLQRQSITLTDCVSIGFVCENSGFFLFHLNFLWPNLATKRFWNLTIIKEFFSFFKKAHNDNNLFTEYHNSTLCLILKLIIIFFNKSSALLNQKKALGNIIIIL
jgi:hypothetical protein